MNLELTDDQTEALIQGLRKLIADDRYPPQSTHCALKEILGKLRPEPEPPPLPPLRHYEPPSRGRFKRR